jgi:hypothetical protein
MLVDTIVQDNVWEINSLILDYNNIRDQCSIALTPILQPPKGIPVYPHLRELSIAKNNLGDRGVAKVVTLMFTNRVLKSLNLSDNGAEQYSGLAIKTLLTDNNVLEHLDIR